MKKKQKQNNLKQEKRYKFFRMRNKNTKNQKKKLNFFFILNRNDIAFICGYYMLGLNFQLPLVFAIIGNMYMLSIQQVLVLGSPNHYKHGVKT